MSASTLQQQENPKLDPAIASNTVKASALNTVYIVGAGRSGSTLLELLLGGHPRMVATGEFEKFSLQFARGSRGKCSCGQSPDACSFWIKVADEIQKHTGVDLRKDPYGFRISDVGAEQDRGKRAWVHWLMRQNYRVWRYAGFSGMPLLRHGAPLAIFHRSWIRNRLLAGDVVRRVAGAPILIDSSKDYLAMRELHAVIPQSIAGP